MAKDSFNPSVKTGLPKLGDKPTGWRLVQFGDVLLEQQRPVKLDDNKDYQLVVAKRSRGGIAERERLAGKKILTKTQFQICEGDFLISNRQIVHGACGIVPRTLNGAIVSNEYTVLHPTADLDLQYLWYLAHTAYFQQTCFHASVGVDIEKMIFSLKKWFKYPICLPPLEEQRRISALLMHWDDAILSCQKLSDLHFSTLQQLLRNAFGSTSRWKRVGLGEVCEIVAGSAFPISRQGSTGNDFPFIKVSDLNLPGNERTVRTWNNSISENDRKALGATAYPPGTLVFPKVGAALLTNKRRLLGVATCVDNNLMGLVPGKRITSDFLYYWSLTLDFGKLVQVGALPSVNQSMVSKLEIPVPDSQEQARANRLFASVEQSYSLYRNLKEQFETQRQGLIQQLLFGQRRMGAKWQ